MKIRHSSWAALALFLSLGPGPVAAQTAARSPVESRVKAPPARLALAPVESEVIVGFKPQADSMRRFALAARASNTEVQSVLTQRANALGARRGRVLQAGQAVGPASQVMRSAGMDAQALARLLAADPEVAYAVPNGRKRIDAAPNDPLYPAVASGARPNGPDSGQWYLRAHDATLVSAINIEAAWARTQGSASTVVAVLDTGVRFDHPDLGRVANGGQLLPGYDFVSNATVANDGSGRDADPSDPGDWVTASESASGTFKDCPLSDSSWHGTATSSLVAGAANNGVGMAGAAPGVRVLPVRVLGKCFGTDADIQAGMLWAAGISVAGVPDNPNPARVINLSLGGAGICDASYVDVVNRITALGVTIVAAAGNSAGGAVNVPANCPGVIGVLALRHAGTKVGFSDLGPEISIAAPGGNCINITAGSACLYPILAATDSGRQGPVSSTWTNSFDVTVGTSFSSPLVAAVAGLMLSTQPGLSPERVRQILQSTARPFPTTGADNGPDDPSPVNQCRAPVANVDQLQCYCTTALCGAGMLDAGAAVAASATLTASVQVLTADPVAGTPVQLSGAGSRTAADQAVSTYQWAITSSGGVVTGFTGATNASTASLTPTAAGTFTVSLTVTDGAGATATVLRSITVAAAPGSVTPPVTPPSTGDTGGGGGGGGATSLLWVLGVVLAVALLHTGARPQMRTTRRRD